ncbi:MAG: DUF2797 domain-containing protein [Flavobacteriales bacterium]|nr:DUF2797 domain-containing protein [Flavobacteriales bacterium]
MKTELNHPVQYYLPIDNKLLGMNQWIGKHIQFNFNGEIYCLDCGQRTKKSFNQGFCYPCFQNSPMSAECIIKPELCRAHLGEGRDMEWEQEHHLKDHYVYLAVSSGVKVGITRDTQVPTRWIDQGASYAVPIAKTPNRYLCGMIEVFLKEYLSDRTAWQRMLKNEITHVDLTEKRAEIIKLVPKEYQEYMLTEEEILNIEYPVNEYPTKVKSLSFDKTPTIQGRLMGIKGQYLLFEDGQVLNMRKHQAYVLEFKADENQQGIGKELTLDF